LRIAADVVRSGRRAWLYWPAEPAIECVDPDRLESLRHHLVGVKWLTRFCLPIDRSIELWHRMPTGLRWIYRGEFPVRRSDIHVRLTQLTMRAQPFSFADFAGHESDRTFTGTGLYCRTDYWNAAASDETTLQIVASLAGITDRLLCLTTRRDASI